MNSTKNFDEERICALLFGQFLVRLKNPDKIVVIWKSKAIIVFSRMAIDFLVIYFYYPLS